MVERGQKKKKRDDLYIVFSLIRTQRIRSGFKEIPTPPKKKKNRIGLKSKKKSPHPLWCVTIWRALSCTKHTKNYRLPVFGPLLLVMYFGIGPGLSFVDTWEKRKWEGGKSLGFSSLWECMLCGCVVYRSTYKDRPSLPCLSPFFSKFAGFFTLPLVVTLLSAPFPWWIFPFNVHIFFPPLLSHLPHLFAGLYLQRHTTQLSPDPPFEFSFLSLPAKNLLFKTNPSLWPAHEY